jgi:hypothetical protein
LIIDVLYSPWLRRPCAAYHWRRKIQATCWARDTYILVDFGLMKCPSATTELRKSVDHCSQMYHINSEKELSYNAFAVQNTLL